MQDLGEEREQLEPLDLMAILPERCLNRGDHRATIINDKDASHGGTSLLLPHVRLWGNAHEERLKS
jgi:hypothetical protein